MNKIKVGTRVKIGGYAYLAEMTTGKRTAHRVDWEDVRKDVVFIGWNTVYTGNVTGHDDEYDDDSEIHEGGALIHRKGNRVAMVCNLARGERYRKPYPVWEDQIVEVLP